MICPYCLTDIEAGVLERWEFILPLEPPSQNVVAQNKGNHVARRKYKKYRDDYVLLLQAAMGQLCIPRATKLRRVVITRLYAGRGQPRDRANIVGGCKPLMDAMHRVGLLVDDSEQYVQDFYRQMPSNESGVAISIEELA